MSQVKGLETVKATGPSVLGIETLYASRGGIPAEFLRACGAPENLITYLPALLAQPGYYSCFICYSHADTAFAVRLHNALQTRGIRCWLDEKEVLPGDNIYEAVDRGVRLWDKLLLCGSKHSLTSAWVDDEIAHAFAKEKELFKERGQRALALIPLDLDGFILDQWQHPKKDLVLERLVADFKGWDQDDARFNRQLENLVRALRSDDSGREPPPPPRL